MKRIIIFFVGVLCLFSLNAQNLKLAHINTQELLEAMPESDSAQKQLEKEAKQLEDQLELMQVEYNNKLEQFLTEREKYSEIILETKESELKDLQERIQSFQGTAQQGLQRKQNKLFKPILDKANKAIEDVAREKGFTYVLDSSTGALIFAGDNAIDILEDVKKKLGIQ